MRIGVDLGGSKIEAVALDARGGEASRVRVPTPDDLAGILAAVAGLVAEAERALGGAARVGVGTPGSIRPDGRLAGSNHPALNGRALDREIAAALGREIRLANDADCFALAEARAGAGQGAGTVFGAILGTGVGGGIAVGGRPLAGPNRTAGEWGHIPLPRMRAEERRGPICHCGRQGCVETFVAGPGLARDHRLATGRGLDPPAIAAAAAGGDAAAQATLARHLDRLARGLAVVVTILDPDVVVLGGGLSRLPGLAERLPEAMAPHLFATASATRVVSAALGESAGSLGAAWLWPDP